MEPPQSLGKHFARFPIHEHLASGSLRKRLLDGYDLPTGVRFPLELFVFQAAAILGAARSERSRPLASLLMEAVAG